jgi:hypothetical protein
MLLFFLVLKKNEKERKNKFNLISHKCIPLNISRRRCPKGDVNG